MSFSFSYALAADLDWVRFWIGDTDAEAHFLHDETITALITSEGSKQAAAIACLGYIINLLSLPDFRTDWLSVTNSVAAEAYRKRRKELAKELGVSIAAGDTWTTSVANLWREDSLQTDADYNENDDDE
jgi:hypothetical protein